MRQGEGGFEAVQKVVEEMIGTLSSEQAGEEKKKNLAASKDELEDMMKSIDSEIAELEDGIEAMDKTAVEATEERKKDHEDYLETVTQSKAAIMLLGKAKNRLNKFYNPSLATSEPEQEEGFVQTPRHHRHHH